MNSIVRKKLNLLTHLARVDGDFHQTEKKMIRAIALDAGVDLDTLDGQFESVGSLEDFGDKEEIIYLAIKLIQADEVITQEELSFCRDLALKLGYQAALVDHFAYQSLPGFEKFEAGVKSWKLQF